MPDCLLLVPAIMDLFQGQGLEPYGRVRDRTAALEMLVSEELSRHDETVRADQAAVNPVLTAAKHCIRTARL